METLIIIGNFALILVSAGLVATGAIIGNEELIKYFLPTMTTLVGVWIGIKIAPGK